MERLLTVLACVEAAALVALSALWLASAEETAPGARLGVSADAPASPGSRADDAVVRGADSVDAAGDVLPIATSPFTPPPGEVVAWPAEGPLGVVLCGRVTSGSGDALGRGRLKASGTLAWAHGEYVADIDDGGGGYAVAGLAPGHYTAKFGAHHHRVEQWDIEITGVPNPLRCDVRLERKTVVRVRVVTPESAALAPSLDWGLRRRIRVWVSAEPFLADRLPPDFDWPQWQRLGGFWWSHQAEDFVSGLGTEHLGVVELAGYPPASVCLVLDRRILGEQPIAPGTEEVTFVVASEALEPKGKLRFRVVAAETGEPLERFFLRIDHTEYRRWRLRRQDDGSTVVPDLGQGPHRGWILGEGRLSKELAFEVRAGEETDLGSIELRAARVVRGRLEDAEGRPRRGPVGAIPLLDPGRSETVWRSVRAARNGAFRLSGLAPERYRVVAWSEGLAASWAIVDASVADVDGVVIRLEAAGTRVTLRAKSAGVKGLDATLSDDLGPLWRGRVGSRRGVELWLEPGSYTAMARAPGSPLRGHSVVVGGDEVVVEITP